MLDPRTLTRADLPAVFTPDTLRTLPMGVLKRLRDPRNGVLSPDDQKAYDAALHQLMADAAQRISGRMDPADWERIAQHAHRGGGWRGAREDKRLQRIARRFGDQVEAAEELAPGVDWSFAAPAELVAQAPPTEPPAAPAESPAESPSADALPRVDEDETLPQFEERMTEQMQLVGIMADLAEMSHRTYDLERQRDRSETRTVFFGFVVSVAVLVAGWAPLVATHDWPERLWIVGLTVATCVVAGVVYALTRHWQKRQEAASEPES